MALGTLILPFDTGAYARPNAVILNGIADPSLAGSFGLVAGDQLSLVLYPRAKSATVSNPTTTVRLPSGCSVIVTGKPLATPGASSVLFEATGFAETQDGNGNWLYTGFLDLNTTELGSAIGSNELSIQVLLVIDIVAAGGSPQRFLSIITIYNESYTGSESAPSPATSGFLSEAQSDARYIRNNSGLQTIGSGMSTVTVTGQAWGAVPSMVLAVVVKNGSSADNIFVVVDSASITADGFTAYLSGAPSDSTHQLFWLAFMSVASETFSPSQSPAVVSNAVPVDLSLAPLTLLDFTAATGTVSISLINASIGQTYILRITQGSSVHGATFPANTKQRGGGGNAYTPSGANAVDVLELLYDGANYLLNQLSAYA
jgi:hypothetical protein